MKAWIARFWPVMRLRTILLGTFLFVAALPGFGAVFLRVYENALVRRTEAELVAQGAAIAASAAMIWPGAQAAAPPTGPLMDYQPSTRIDLGTDPILPERPAPVLTGRAADPAALAVAQQLAPVLAETRRVTLASIILLDREKVVLNGVDAGKEYSDQVFELIGPSLGATPTVMRRNGDYQRRSRLEWLSRAADIRLHHARPITVNGEIVGIVLLSRSPRALLRGIYEDRGKIAFGVVLILAILTGVSLVLARTIVRPVEALSAASRALASGTRVTPRRSALNVVEISTLFDDFEAMSANIERRSAYLRDFAAAVSHEFKTPIAALHGAIELLDDHGTSMDEGQRRQFLENMRQDTDRLSLLVSRLLDLARADMRRIDGDTCADVGGVFKAVGARGGWQGMTVSVQLPELPLVARIDYEALESVLVTLVDNAAQAGADRLAFSVSRDDGMAVIRVANNGPAIPPADREKIFEPFFTSRRATGGTGMGLAIARSLLAGYRATLTLEEPAPGTGSRVDVAFILKLPLNGPA